MTMKWKIVGGGIYESGVWVIENQKTFLNPHMGWAVYKNRVFIGRESTLRDAKKLAAWREARPSPDWPTDGDRAQAAVMLTRLRVEG